MAVGNDTNEFWDSAFIEKGEMWGDKPSRSAVLAADLFIRNSVRTVLIPGIGYGRNAQPFLDSNMSVTGIEISKTAVELATKRYGATLTVYHGSVTDMPFDQCRYDGIYSHGLLHLLDSADRRKHLQDCYNQLEESGVMAFSVISKSAPMYGTGRFISEDRYEIHEGAPIFFYDRESIESEFDGIPLVAVDEFDENFPFYLIQCRKV